MAVNQHIVEKIIKPKKTKSPSSESPPILQLKDILKNKVIKDDAIFRLSINDYKYMCKNKILKKMMALQLNTTYKKLTKFCNIVHGVGEHIDLSTKKINAMEAPLFKTITDLPDELKDKIIGHYTSMISTIFTSLKTFLFSLSKEVEEGNTLIPKIVDSFSENDKIKIVNAIDNFFDDNVIEPSNQKLYFDGFFKNANTDNFNIIIKTYIRNIYSNILYPSISTKLKLDLDKNIEKFSNLIQLSYFKQTNLESNIKKHLFSFVSEYTPKLDDRLVIYISNLIDDGIDKKYVYKFPRDDREKTIRDDRIYCNVYYTLLDSIEIKNTKTSFKNELTPNGKFVLEKINSDNNFTYEECKTWAMMPIFNPRTIEPIEIDSPRYNRLLCLSYKYNLLPRMITSRGFYAIFKALYN